jgi:hypothetical protein
MNHKITLAQGDPFHFYKNESDEEHVFLELSPAEFQTFEDLITLRIPMDIWMVMRQVKAPEMHLVESTDQDLIDLANNDVDERMAQHVAATTERRRDLIAMFSSALYGEITEPRDDQVQLGIKYLMQLRETQRAILARSRLHEVFEIMKK